MANIPVFGLDFVGVDIAGDKAIFKYITTGLAKTTVELKTKIQTMLDLPFDIPSDITITEVKKGPILKQYYVEVAVPRERIGRLRNLISKKYGIIRYRPYSG